MYCEFHLHTNFSLLDGASHSADLLSRARELEMPALAITDHDALYAIVPFYKYAREIGIKPIIGTEVTLENGSHLTLLARDNSGYSNLCRFLSRAHLSHTKGSPSLDFASLARHSSGLICLSGCQKGEIASLLLSGEKEKALAAARKYLDIFGKDNFWIELQNHLCRQDRKLVAQLVALAKSLGLGYVATNNVHYASRGKHKLQDILVCIKNRTTLDSSCQLRRPNSEFYLKSGEEMTALFGNYPEAIASTLSIAEQCDVSLDFSGYRFPDFPLPNGESTDTYLERLCWLRAREKYGEFTAEVEARIKYELDLIKRFDLPGYFLIVWDIMDFARKSSIPAQGRGSAANSVVAYLLGITRVDPIRHRLFFGRFLNEEMSSVPDIDIDISTNHREKLIQYVYEKYGEEHTAMVCTYITFQARNAIREVGKALGLPPNILDGMAKAVGHYGAGDLGQDLEKLEKFREYVTSMPWQEFLSLCQEIADFPRHLSIHVGGMLISSCPLTEIVPLERAAMPGRVVCQWDKDGVQDAGLIKVDLLGLRMLSLIQEAVELVEQNHGIRLDMEKIPQDDPAVYDMICQADTIGVFQVESRAQMQTLPKTRPRSIEDLTVEVAIIRPGPIQGNMVHPYIRRRKGLEKVTYLHPKIKPILEETLGVILFQEQVIQVAIAIAGFSAGEADSLRRAMSRKRSKEAIEKLRLRFLEGARENKVSEGAANQVFESLKGFAEYGFCKSHAAGFALLCCQSAWLKKYYPAEFYAALLNNQPMGFYSPEVIVNDARRHGTAILPVDINKSQARCMVEDGKVRLGFRYVKEMGEKSWGKVERERERGLFTSLKDFYQRTGLEREAIDNLILVGAMDCFSLPKRQLLWQLGLIDRESKYLLRGSLKGRSPFRNNLSSSPSKERGIQGVRIGTLPLEFKEQMVMLPELTEMEEVANDYQVQGLSARRHPMQLVRENISGEGILRSCDIARLSDNTGIRIAGYVVCRQQPMTAKGHVFLTLEDEYGLFNVVLKPKIYEKYRYIARIEPLIVVEGILQKKDGVHNIVAQRLLSLRETATEMPLG